MAGSLNCRAGLEPRASLKGPLMSTMAIGACQRLCRQESRRVGALVMEGGMGGKWQLELSSLLVTVGDGMGADGWTRLVSLVVGGGWWAGRVKFNRGRWLEEGR